MARCGHCNSVIVFGGARQGRARFCNTNCRKKNAQKNQIPVSDRQLESVTHEVHAGPCSLCLGDGPVDVHNVHSIWSLVWFTKWKTKPVVGCRSCGRKSQVQGIVFSSLLGWWGFPWGAIVTPIQIVRNLVGMARPPHPEHPSEDLYEYLRDELTSGRLNMETFQFEDDGIDDAVDVNAVDVIAVDVIAVVCRGCDHRFDVKTHLAGCTEYCPQCGLAFTVPERDEHRPTSNSPTAADGAGDQWKSIGQQSPAAETGMEDWDDVWNEQWRDVDVRYGGTRGIEAGDFLLNDAGKSGKRRMPSLLAWIVVAVFAVGTLVCVMGFVLLDEPAGPIGARQPDFGDQRPIDDQAQRLRDAPRPGGPLRRAPELPTVDDRMGQPLDSQIEQPRPISPPRAK